MSTKRLVERILLLLHHAFHLNWSHLIPQWTRLRDIGNSTPVKLTILIPLVGYLIIFNNALVQYWDLAREYVGAPTGAVSIKLPLIYFGLCALAVGSAVYSWTCPEIVKRYPSGAAYVGGDGPNMGDWALDSVEKEIRGSTHHNELQRIRKRFDVDPKMMSFLNSQQIAERRQNTVNAVLHLYFALWNASKPLARLIVSIAFLLGFSALLIPSLQVFYRVITILVGIKG